jgi:hypothetical protein
VWGGRYDREPCLFQVFYNVASIADDGDLHVLSCAFRDTARRARKGAHDLRLHDDPGDAEEAAGAEDRSNVVRILHPLQEYDHSALNIGHTSDKLSRFQDLNRLGLDTHPFVMFGASDSRQFVVLDNLGGDIALSAPL